MGFPLKRTKMTQSHRPIDLSFEDDAGCLRRCEGADGGDGYFRTPATVASQLLQNSQKINTLPRPRPATHRK